MGYTSDQIRKKYDGFARWYDLLDGVPSKLLGVTRLRCLLLKGARGRVLEVAAGTGANLAFYPPDIEIICTDLSGEMLAVGRRKAERKRIDTPFIQADAEALPFSSASFDTVASTLSLCTFPNPSQALSEFARVCRPDGRILLLEHGRSRVEWLGRFQDRRADAHAQALGCYWNREPDRLVLGSGLRLVRQERFLAGVFYLLEAVPDRSKASA